MRPELQVTCNPVVCCFTLAWKRMQVISFHFFPGCYQVGMLGFQPLWSPAGEKASVIFPKWCAQKIPFSYSFGQSFCASWPFSAQLFQKSEQAVNFLFHRQLCFVSFCHCSNCLCEVYTTNKPNCSKQWIPKCATPCSIRAHLVAFWNAREDGHGISCSFWLTDTWERTSGELLAENKILISWGYFCITLACDNSMKMMTLT